MGTRDRRGKTLDANWREKIRTGVLLDRLAKHVVGTVEMSATQVQAARILLGKTIPDMKAIEHSGEVVQKVHAVIVPAKQLESDGNAVASITQAG